MTATAQQSGLDFFVVGDFGNMGNLGPAKAAFDAMNSIKANGSKIDMFVTVGDNLYPTKPEYPTEAEVKKMIGLFKGDKIKDLPVYGVRGNHDCYFKNQKILLDLAKTDKQWTMPSYYYSKEFKLGPGGEKFGMLVVDSCLLLCSEKG